jgi:hypothetical protein
MLTREQSSREHTREHTASTASSTGTDEYGMPQALEPRLTFAIDPQLPPREKKPFEAEAGKVKISASPGMPTVSTVGVQIFHRAMRIHADTDTEDIPHHYLLMRIFSGVGSRGRSYRLEAYNPKLSHSAQVTMSEPRFTRLIAGRSDMLLPGSERADFLAMVIQEAIIVKNAVILAHMRLIVRKDGTTRVAREIKRREHEELARIETKSYRFGLRVRYRGMSKDCCLFCCLCAVCVLFVCCLCAVCLLFVCCLFASPPSPSSPAAPTFSIDLFGTCTHPTPVITAFK